MMMSAIDELALIKNVCSHPVLYDPFHIDYQQITIKANAWKTIAKDMGYGNNGDILKHAWTKLRNSYREARARRQLNGTARPWRYSSEMAFLEPYMQDRVKNLNNERIANQSIPNNHELAYSNSFDSTIYNNNETHATFKRKDSVHIKEEVTIAIDDGKESNGQDSIAPHAMEKNASGTAKDTGSCATEANVPGPDPNDPLYNFFLSMYQTTKMLPASCQFRIKSRIFAVVTNEEAETLNLN